MVHNNNSEEVTTYREELCCLERKFSSLKTDFAAKLKALEVKVTQATSSANTAGNKAKEANEQIKRLATKAELAQYQKK